MCKPELIIIEKHIFYVYNSYSILMYIVKKDDTLWKIAKRFGSTVEDIVRINGIEDENKIYPDQKLFIPHYSKASVKEYA